MSKCVYIILGHSVFMGRDCQPHAQPQTWRAKVLFSVSSPLTCLAWETLSVAILLALLLSG